MKRPFNFLAGMLALATLTLLASGTVYAHPGLEGVGGGFLAGLTHPLLGLDHIVAMVAVGLWSLSQVPKFRSMIPLLAMLGMLLGALSAWAGLVIPGMEFGVAMSVLLMGLLLITLARMPTSLGSLIVVLFLFCHGQAHGSEMPSGIAPWAYLAGFTVATLGIIYLARRAGSLMAARDKHLLKGIGVAIAALGASFVIG
ncbi:HupE/UreJ family protein [Modicisalibacter luteus]|uniref:HupE/UreJ family protein n=1 Tax=Modicisalibacter luteus TaxID=453962 RepID=A0ABV7M3Q2_9GAMM|nr:HupE/UreJ family protein [Halomonas lutea]GHA87438.1 protein hupE [Halomonas lutea]